MEKELLEKLKGALEFPVYLLVKEPLRVVVTKVELWEGVFKVYKHVVMGTGRGWQCSCLGFTKTGMCKHVHMVDDDFEGKGVDGHIAVEELERLARVLDPDTFDKGHWDFCEDRIPERLSSFVLHVPPGKVKKPVTLVYEKTLPGGSLVIRVEFATS